MSKADQLAEILAEGLDLCVRARKLDEVVQEISPDHPENSCDHPITRSYTPALWVRDQYDTDLADWEKRARELMVDLGYG